MKVYECPQSDNHEKKKKRIRRKKNEILGQGEEEERDRKTTKYSVLLTHSSHRTLASTDEKENRARDMSIFRIQKDISKVNLSVLFEVEWNLFSHSASSSERRRRRRRIWPLLYILPGATKPSNLLLMIESDDPFIPHVFGAIATISLLLHPNVVICYLDSFKQTYVWKKKKRITYCYSLLLRKKETNINSHRFCVFIKIIKPHKRKKMPEDLLIIMLVSFLSVRYIFSYRLFSRVIRISYFRRNVLRLINKLKIDDHHHLDLIYHLGIWMSIL